MLATAPVRVGVRAMAAAAVALLGLGLGLAACSSGGSDGYGGASSTRPEDRVVTDAEVTKGLANVRAATAQILATLGSDPAAAKRQVDAMYDLWFGFEGTVRKNERDLYLQMEDGLNGIKAGVEKGNADRAQRGKADLDQAADAYLAKHP